MQSQQNSKFSRIDYIQVGLTSKNAFKLVRGGGVGGQQTAEVVIGDHSGSLHMLSLRTDSNQTETVFKTLPGPNSKINCVELFSGSGGGSSSSARILAALGSSTIRGYNKKGKQFFCLELNNLTEPIKLFKMRWPDEIFVVGQYIYNSYLINSESINAGGSGGGGSNFSLPTSNKSSAAFNSVVKSRHYYVCPERINDMIMLEDRFNRKTIPVLACQDRLLRVLKDSTCSFEVEICGIPSVVQIAPLFNKPTLANGNIGNGETPSSAAAVSGVSTKAKSSSKNEDVHLCYGTLDGKIALVTFHFVDKNQLEPLHKWEVPVNAIKQPVTCLVFSETGPEFYVGRSDGSVEIWRLSESIDEDSVQSVDLNVPPTLQEVYSCGESVTNILPVTSKDTADNCVLLCSTFTGLIFGLVKHGEVLTQMRQLNPNYLIISKDNAARIETLKEECEKLEKKLDMERQKYEKHTSSQGVSEFMKDSNLSALPFFTINDSFVLHNDASYVLMLEVEVAIDVVFIHCDIGLDLIDCERNSAVISFNDPPTSFTEGGGGGTSSPGEMLATFRCQANTTRLEIRLRPVEGQRGTLSVYVVSRITPKSCLTRSYEIQPLALHKRQHSNTSIEYANSLVMTGAFGINDAHTWLRMNIPEIPEKLSLSTEGVESEVFYYTSTMTRSILIVNCGRGTISITSDNVSTVSILKDFLTREATRQSIPIEISVEISERSIAVILRHLYPKIKRLILEKQRQDLFEAISDLQSSDADIASQLLADLNLEEKETEKEEAEGKRRSVLSSASAGQRTTESSTGSSGTPSEANRQDVLIGLDRIYGIITDLFIDYHKLKGTSMASFLKAAKEKLDEMTTLIETAVLEAVSSKSMPPELAAVLSDPASLSSASSASRGGGGPLRAKDESTAFAERLYHFWDIQL